MKGGHGGGGEGGLVGGGDTGWKLFFSSLMLYVTVSPFLLSCFTLLFCHSFFMLYILFLRCFIFSVVDQLVCFCLCTVFFSLFFCLFVLFIVVLLYYLTLNVDYGVR